jgi:transmembrane sensor
MEPLEFKNLLDKYSRGECTAAEEKIILEWYESINAKNHRQSASEAAEPEIEARLWSKIRPGFAPPRRNHFFYFVSAAATFIVLMVAGLGLYFSSHKKSPARADAPAGSREARNLFVHEVNTGDKPREILLPDKSIVTLKPGSALRFSKNFEGDKREVHLSGEAFFRVQKEATRPFLVYSNEVVTKVLGTSFNIRAYASDKEVTVVVKTGKVSVYTNTDNRGSENLKADQPEIILTPNYQVVYNRSKDRVSKQVVEVPEIILSQPTLFEMQYDGVPVSGIFEVLEENYGVDIDFDEAQLKNCMLTTSMSDEGFYERIEIICRAIGAEYVATDAGISIKSHGCL